MTDINNGMSEEELIFKQHVENKAREVNMSNPTFVKQNQEQEKIKEGYLEQEFYSIPVSELPCGRFYPTGTLVKCRAAKVSEIQAYSMVDDTNFYDVVEKMNEILSTCIRIKYPNEKFGTYLDLKDADRFYCIFLIRELTFQKGLDLKVTTKCPDGTEVDIALRRGNFIFEDQKDLDKWYNPVDKCYVFKTKIGKTFRLSPPTIGIQRSFTDYVVKQTTAKKKINMSFLKIVPFTLGDINEIDHKDIEEKLKEFESIDEKSFQFLNSAVSKMRFGIKELKAKCKECGTEVRTEMVFPTGASGIFVVHDAFDEFIEE